MGDDTAKGMTSLHRRRVVHRDLKSLNLLLASKVEGQDMPCTKISDFGLARPLPADAVMSSASESSPVEQSLGMMTGGVGTYHWMAPEILTGRSYDERVDVYSYGVVLYELLCRRIP